MTENSKNSWGGKRPGAGRRPGSQNEATKQRAAVKQAYQERIAANADRLFNSQFNLATGEHYLMWRHKTGSGAKERTVVEVVTDPEIIKQFINEELNQSGDDEWYFLSTKPANGMAIDSMLDRAFGKAEANLNLDGELKGNLTVQLVNYEDIANGDNTV